MVKKQTKIIISSDIDKPIPRVPVTLNGFTRKVVTRDGSVYEAAYYKIASLRYSGGNGRQKRVTFCFDIWSSIEARGKNQPLRNIPGNPTFEARDKDYEKWFSPKALRVSKNDPFAQAYLFAKAQFGYNNVVDVEK